jgi:hypothetical protein
MRNQFFNVGRFLAIVLLVHEEVAILPCGHQMMGGLAFVHDAQHVLACDGVGPYTKFAVFVRCYHAFGGFAGHLPNQPSRCHCRRMRVVLQIWMCCAFGLVALLITMCLYEQ